MGSGPEHFLENGLAKVLETDGHKVRVESVKTKSKFRAEIQTQFELYGLLSERIAEARREGKFPLILSGNCGASLGAIAGAETARMGIIWFDAHGDFNTPEATTGGFLDGMGLAITAGLCWKKLAVSIPNFSPVRGTNILHLGGRDFDVQEREMFEQVGATVLDAASFEQPDARDALKTAILRLQSSVEEVHLHIDLDVLNPKVAPANEYVTCEGGLSAQQVVEAVQLIGENLKITSATIASFDPNFDPLEKTLQVGLKLIGKIIECSG